MGRWKIFATFAILAVIAAGCGDDGTSAETDTTPTDETPTTEDAGVAEEGEPEANDAEAAESAAPDASPYVSGFGDLSAVSLPDGDPGEVSIVWSAETLDQRGSATMIVRNNTSEAIGRIDVTGTARDDAGDLVGSGSSQGFSPAFVASGEIAYGYVYFDFELAEQGFEFSFEVDAESVSGGFASGVPVTITELNNTGEQLIGTASNELDEDVGGPINAAAICFDDAGAVTGDWSGFLEQDNLASGATGSFSIDLFDPCPNGLVSVSGYDF